LRFAVLRPGIPDASPRSHGVPHRDISSRIHISVTGETAGSAHEVRLTLARLPVHVPACRAALASECRFDLHYPARRLLFQSAHQQAPSGLQDASVEPGFLADIPAWVLRSTFGGSGHVPDLEVLDADRIESDRDVRAGLLYPVLAPVRLADVQLGDGQPNPTAPSRAAPCPGQLPLQTPQPLPFSRGQAWRVQQFTRRQGRADNYAPVNTDHLAVARCRDRAGNGCEGDMPASSAVHRHPIGFHARRHRPGPAESHPPGFRNPDLAGLPAQPPHVPLLTAPPHDPEPLIPANLPPRRPPSWAVRIEERGHRLGKVPQRLLLHHLRACGQPRVLRPRLGELPTLLKVPWSALPSRPPVLMLLDGEVPHIPGVRAVHPQRRLLGGCREQSVPGHANTLSITTDISGEVKRRFLREVRAEVFAPRSL
jgi:hypothetical protein